MSIPLVVKPKVQLTYKHWEKGFRNLIKANSHTAGWHIESAFDKTRHEIA